LPVSSNGGGSIGLPPKAPDGTHLNTLREAVAYLAKTVPKSERKMPAFTTAAEMLAYAPRMADDACPHWRHESRLGLSRSVPGLFRPVLGSNQCRDLNLRASQHW
jgi:hypothetical protein